jgi:hypothetical protein
MSIAITAKANMTVIKMTIQTIVIPRRWPSGLCRSWDEVICDLVMTQ